MSKLEELLQGVDVKWLPLGDYAIYEQPTKYLVKSKDYNNEYNTPVLTAGKTFVLGYTNENDGIYKASLTPVIIFDDFTTANKWVDFDFKAKSSAMKIIKSKDESKILLRYIYYWINSLPSDLTEGDHKRQWISNFSKKIIPIPCPDNPEKSLEIQQEIVRVLDELTSLTNQLTTELESERQNRKKQFEFFREQLFRFEEDENNYVALGELAENLDSKRKPITSSQRKPGKIPYYGASGIVDYVEDYIFDGDYLLVSEDGANLLARSTPIAFSISGKNWVNNHAHILKFETKYERLFVEYYLNSIDLAPYITGAAQPKLNKKNLNSIKIPNPALEEKERIVKLLDQFDATHTAIEEEIIKEIKLRTQQYEYYREKLLSFPQN